MKHLYSPVSRKNLNSTQKMKILFIPLIFLLMGSCGQSQSKQKTESLDLQKDRDLYLYSKKVDGGIYPDYKTYGYVDSAKKIVIEAKYDMAKPFDGKVAKVAKIKKVPDRWNRGPCEQLMWGLIDKRDSILIDFEYYELKGVPLSKYAALGFQKSFLFNESGDTLKSLLHNREFERPFNDTLIIVLNKDRKMGVMDSNYHYFVKPKYSSIDEPSEGRMMAYIRKNKEDYIGYLDMNGEEVIPLIYNAGGPFQDSTALVRNRKGSILLIDNSGTVISQIDQPYIDSLITEKFTSSDFSGFNDCINQLKNKSIYQSLVYCSDFLFNKQLLKNKIETCPGPIGSECSTTTTFAIYSNAFFKTRTFYEGFPNIDIYLPKADLELSKEWAQIFMGTIGFEYDSKKEPEANKLLQNYSHPDFSSDATVTINCDSSYCTIRPYISYNY